MLLALVPRAAWPSTWVDVEVVCPVCGTTNVFKTPASFGTYIYQDVSRFQYVFWPATTPYFLYTCRRCHLTAYMQDFRQIPKSKIETIEAMLAERAKIEGDVLPYYEIPMDVRLGIARRVYEILGRDDAFWCEFERIAGYHFAEARQPQSAHAARSRALARAETLLETQDPSTRKETLVIVGSMRFFTGDVAGARKALDEAESLTFTGSGREAATLDRYLSQLIRDLRTEILGDPAAR